MVGVSGAVLVHGNAYHTDRTRKVFCPTIVRSDAPSISTGNFGGHDIGGGTPYVMTVFIVPEDFASFDKVYMVGISQAVTAWAMTFTADWGADGETSNTATESKTSVSLINPAVTNKICIADTTLVLAGLAIGDILGIKALDVTGDTHVQGMIFEYEADM